MEKERMRKLFPDVFFFFAGVIRRASEQAGCGVVVLVDEYDKPLLQALGNGSLLDDYRRTLKAFYGSIEEF